MWLGQITDQMKKTKKILESWNGAFHKCQYWKLSNVNLASVSQYGKKSEKFTDSTLTTYWPRKWLRKSLEHFADQMKKAKKYWEVGKKISERTILKALKYKSCLSFRACQKKSCGIYWLNSYNLVANKYS